jgi:SulP family sulfate permease
MKDVHTTEEGKQVHHLVLAEEVSFFNKASVLNVLANIPADSKVIIDFEKSKAVAHDVIEVIDDYRTNAKTKNIDVEIRNLSEAKKSLLQKS